MYPAVSHPQFLGPSSKLHFGQCAGHTERIEEGLRLADVHIGELDEQWTDRLCRLLRCFLAACGKQNAATP